MCYLRFRDQFQLQLQPALTLLLQDPSISTQMETIRIFKKLFESIEQTSILWQTLSDKRSAAIHKLWSSEVAVSNHSFKPQIWIEWIVHSFLPRVLAMLTQEQANLIDMFDTAKEGHAVLVLLLEKTLQPLHQLFQNRLERISVDHLDWLFGQMCDFTVSVLQLFRPDPLASSNVTNTDEEFNSKMPLQRVIECVFTPFKPIYQDFAMYLKKAAVQELSLSMLEWKNTNTIEGLVEAMKESSLENIWNPLEELVKQTHSLSGGLLFADYVDGACQSIREVSSSLVDTLMVIRERDCTFRMAAQDQCCRYGGADVVDEMISYQKDSSFDWPKFHAALELLTLCGDIGYSLQIIQRRISIRIQQQLISLEEKRQLSTPTTSSQVVLFAAAYLRQDRFHTALQKRLEAVEVRCIAYAHSSLPNFFVGLCRWTRCVSCCRTDCSTTDIR